MINDKRNRIFWLGMHVVLTKTELPRLRALGYEVFNPPYLADIYDQSAVTEFDRDQATTLPPEVFRELSEYNFFYDRVSPRIAELLNEYFGTVIVTISPVWLQSMLEAFHGRLIYRVFGQPGTLSESLWSMGLFRSIQERDNFYFVPHTEEAVDEEHAWLKSRMAVVPYTLAHDVFEHENTWSPDEPHAPEIMVCCPNIDNPYYSQHYQYLNAQFPESYFKLYGVQPREVADPRVAGTLPREELLSRYRRASGYWYHYDIANNCYLPPVEMMTVGGPVIYMRGSLLARSFQSPGPGEAASIEDAKRKVRLLLAGDRGFVNELRAAQRQIVRRYHPDHVHPIFDRTFRQLIDRPDAPRQKKVVLSAGESPSPRKRAFVLFHAPGEHVYFHAGKYAACDDLARTVKQIAFALLEDAERDVVVTCFSKQLQHAFGYLGADRFPGQLQFHVLDPEQLAPQPFKPARALAPDARPSAHQDQMLEANAALAASLATRSQSAPLPTDSPLWRLLLGSLALIGRSRMLLGSLLFIARTAMGLVRLARRARTRLGERKSRIRAWLGRRLRAPHSHDPWISRNDCIRRLNAESGDVVVIVPHESLFPEALLVTQRLVLCLPDEVYPAGARRMGLRAKLDSIISRRLVEKAEAVLATSEISQSRLFSAGLQDDSHPQRGVVRGPTKVERGADSERHPDLAVGKG